MRAPLVIGVDVGGTKILSGLVDREGNVIEEREVQSPGEDATELDVLAAIDAAVDALREAIPPANETLRIPAELGAEAGLVGAGLVGFEALDGLR